MQNIELEPLEELELKETNGGFIPIIAAFIISDIATVALGMGLYNGYKNAGR